MADKRLNRKVGPKLSSVTFRVAHPTQLGLVVTEKHNGLFVRNLTPYPRDRAALHVQDYEISGRVYRVELRVTPFSKL